LDHGVVEKLEVIVKIRSANWDQRSVLARSAFAQPGWSIAGTKLPLIRLATSADDPSIPYPWIPYFG
jgi:hypothetical protein